MEEILKIIKQELQNRKMTYAEFSPICGITPGTLAQIFAPKNNANPTIATINTMLTALGLSSYAKTPEGTVLTEKEQRLMNLITRCDERQQDLAMAYISGMLDKNVNIGSRIIKKDSDSPNRSGGNW